MNDIQPGSNILVPAFPGCPGVLALGRVLYLEKITRELKYPRPVITMAYIG